MSKPRMKYTTCCIHAKGEDISDMVEQARDVTFRTFCRHCEGWKYWAQNQGYQVGSQRGLHLKDDWAVSFHKSRYQGKPCYYVRWSSIEFIWT